MASFFCLQKNYFDGNIEVIPLQSKTDSKAWQEVEEIAETNSHEWLVSLEQLKKLKEGLNDI